MITRTKIFSSLFASMLVVTPSIISASTSTTDECTSAWCTGISVIDNFGDEAWWLSRYEGAENNLNSMVEEAILNAALPYVGAFLPFLNVGNTGPSELDLAVDAILDAINQSETNVIDAIIAESLIQTDIDWIAMQNNSAYYFSYPDEYKDTLYRSILDNLYLDITHLRYVFQIDRSHSNVNRAFDTYNYDSFHTYLNIVAMEILITIEHTRMTMIVDNPNVTAEAIEQQVRTVLTDVLSPTNLDSPFSYISWLDTNWRQASDERFPIITDWRDRAGHVIAYSSNIEPYHNYKSLFSDQRCFNDGPRGKSVVWIYPYVVDGTRHAVHVKSWYEDLGYSGEGTNGCHLVEDSLGNIIGTIYTDGGIYIPRDWVVATANAAISSHKEAAYPEYLLSVYEPARDILDGWWGLLGVIGNRPILAADRTLENTYPTMFRQSFDHSLFGNKLVNHGTENEVWVETEIGNRYPIEVNYPYSVDLDTTATAYCDLMGYKDGAASYQSYPCYGDSGLYLSNVSSSWRFQSTRKSKFSGRQPSSCNARLYSVTCNQSPTN